MAVGSGGVEVDGVGATFAIDGQGDGGEETVQCVDADVVITTGPSDDESGGGVGKIEQFAKVRIDSRHVVAGDAVVGDQDGLGGGIEDHRACAGDQRVGHRFQAVVVDHTAIDIDIALISGQEGVGDGRRVGRRCSRDDKGVEPSTTVEGDVALGDDVVDRLACQVNRQRVVVCSSGDHEVRDGRTWGGHQNDSVDHDL